MDGHCAAFGIHIEIKLMPIYDENNSKITMYLFAAALNASGMPPLNRYSAATGMAVFQAGDDVEAILKRADQAMYEAKDRKKRDRAERPSA